VRAQRPECGSCDAGRSPTPPPSWRMAHGADLRLRSPTALLLAVNLNVARDAFGHRDRSRERDPAQVEAVLAYLGT
jgi:hypothetical protein